MKPFSKILGTSLLALALMGAGCIPSLGAKHNTQESAVNGFFDAVQDKDHDAAVSYIDPDSELYGEFDDAWGEIEKLDLHSYSILSKEGNELEVQLELEKDGETDTESTTVEVIEKDGSWWLVSI
jgi:hypothetical protein